MALFIFTILVMLDFQSSSFDAYKLEGCVRFGEHTIYISSLGSSSEVRRPCPHHSSIFPPGFLRSHYEQGFPHMSSGPELIPCESGHWHDITLLVGEEEKRRVRANVHCIAYPSILCKLFFVVFVLVLDQNSIEFLEVKYATESIALIADVKKVMIFYFTTLTKEEKGFAFPQSQCHWVSLQRVEGRGM